MRLINTETLAVEEFYDDQIPPYAILSHTWSDGEVTFDDWSNETLRKSRRGWQKIENAVLQAREPIESIRMHSSMHVRSTHELPQSYSYLWVDTCCIDKRSSAELTEAINSMYTWYEDSEMCLVYLEDMALCRRMNEEESMDWRGCRWFTRGWTLQELLAPKRVYFFDTSWQFLGSKDELSQILSGICSIPSQVLEGELDIQSCSVARRMSWASNRRTTRVEDAAYCLLGVFGVNLPLLYGEGERAFIRLQEEFIRHSNDVSILNWSSPPNFYPGWQGCLAPHASAFASAASLYPRLGGDSFFISNKGLEINMPALHVMTSDAYLVTPDISKATVPGRYDQAYIVESESYGEHDEDRKYYLRSPAKCRGYVPEDCLHAMEKQKFILKHERNPKSFRRHTRSPLSSIDLRGPLSSAPTAQSDLSRFAVLPVSIYREHLLQSGCSQVKDSVLNYIQSLRRKSSIHMPELDLIPQYPKTDRLYASLQGRDSILGWVDMSIVVSTDKDARWIAEISYVRDRDRSVWATETSICMNKTAEYERVCGSSTMIVRILPITFRALLKRFQKMHIEAYSCKICKAARDSWRMILEIQDDEVCPGNRDL